MLWQLTPTVDVALDEGSSGASSANLMSLPQQSGHPTQNVDAGERRPQHAGLRRFWSSLYRKYVSLFLSVVGVALFSNGLFQAWNAAQEHRTALIRIQQEQANSAASKITQFIREIESHLGWTTQLPWSASALEQRRFDGLRLLRQVPAITALSLLDEHGREQLRVSRMAMDVVGSLVDHSEEPSFKRAAASNAYYGPVYFRRETEPYMTFAMAGISREAGVSVAEVNLKFVWDVVSQILVGEQGHAFVVDANGRLIGHPDISLVLRNTDMTRLGHVRAALQRPTLTRAGEVSVGTDLSGKRVITAHAEAAPTGWLVFVDLPETEANAPLHAALERLVLLLFAGLGLAALAGLFLARRMLVPMETLRAGAYSFGSGNLDERISIRTGDELEELAASFNDMAGRLAASYAGLERMSRLKRFLAPQIAEVVASDASEAALASHRREISVLFCDLRGFTGFAETSEPEEVMNVLREYQGAVGERIFEHEGTLERFTGDGIMVFFNDPVPCPDHCIRAARLAIDIRERVREMARGWSMRGYTLGIGIGIATGNATLGRIGFDKRFDYAAIGTVTNVAARLCAEAQPGQILTTKGIATAIGDLACARQLDDRLLKGLHTPVAIYELAGNAQE